MIIIISPAKSVNFKEPAPTESCTTPDFLDQSKQLVKRLKRYKTAEIMDLMSVSERIADLNVARYQAFNPAFDLENAKQALFAFTGDVYRHMRMNTYNENTLDFAQAHLRILSGLYGYLRPLDLIQPYRLEMKTRLENSRGKDLYHFWGDLISKALNKDLAKDPHPALINLASREYARVINFKSIEAPVITIDFKEVENGKAKVIAIFAKWARGMMTDHIIQNQITEVEALKDFDRAEYRYSSGDSDDTHWVFTRPRPE